MAEKSKLLPEIVTEQGKCWVTGAAWVEPNYRYDERTKRSSLASFYYVSLIGPPAQVTSVWASLVKRKGHIGIREWEGYRGFGGMVEGLPARRMVKVIHSQPRYIHATIITLSTQLILLTSPGKTFPYNDDERRPLVGPLLAAYINTHTPYVCKPEWGEWIFKNTVQSYINREAVVQLRCAGDCLAYHVTAGLNWGNLLAEGIKKGELS